MISKRDFYFAISTGIITGVITWRIFSYLKIPNFYYLSHSWLILIVPIIWIFGLLFGRLINRFFQSSIQFSKFVAIGFTNAAIDFGYLNILIAHSGISKGFWFAIFKTGAFMVANTNSYFLNKYWSFESSSKDPNEFSKFLIITIISLLINVGIATFLVTNINPLFSLSGPAWANVSSVVGAAISLIVNFLGYKLVVFKK